jgi:hypothetical protein
MKNTLSRPHSHVSFKKIVLQKMSLGFLSSLITVSYGLSHIVHLLEGEGEGATVINGTRPVRSQLYPHPPSVVLCVPISMIL